MRSAIGLGIAACVAAIVLLVGAEPSVAEFDLPARKQLQWMALGKLPDYDVSVTPAVEPYTVDGDLSNVHKSDALGYLTAEQKLLLANNGFLILPSASKEFYEIYFRNPAPLVTSDCVFHAYHVLLAETLRQAEIHFLAKRQMALALAGYRRMKEIAAVVPEPLEPAARDALIYWAVAARLTDPEASVPLAIAAATESELSRIRKASLIGRVGETAPTRDYTVYKPIAGYSESQALRTYFVLNRYFTLATQPFESDRQARTCVLIALAVGTDAEARSAYLDIARFREFLGGLGEDPTPVTLLAAVRKTFGGKISASVLADPDKLARLRQAVAAQPRPTVADQPQSVPGADPLAGYGMRMFPPGVSVRALAYQRVAEVRARTPQGEHVAAVLGTELPAVREDLSLLEGAKVALARRGRRPERQAVHTLAMLALSHLSRERGAGYPSFMATDAWDIKVANTQMGAWSEVEHDLCLYVKDNALYACEVMGHEGFHGYVEPVPHCYAALAALTRRTGDAFDALGVFARIAATAPKPPKEAPRWHRPPVKVTRAHFRALETLLLGLRDMAVKALGNRPFDEPEIKLLKELGSTLKHLALNDSSSPEAKEPMSVIVRIAREYLEQNGRYVGVGRPLKILAVVPYAGRLHWAVGGIYSYYEFDRPLRRPLTDSGWKAVTGAALVVQPYPAWLMDKGVGLNAGHCSAERLRAWLPTKKERMGFSHGGRLREWLLRSDRTMTLLSRLGSTQLTDQAVDVACAAMAEGRLDEHVMACLYILLRDAPEEKRLSTCAAALKAIEQHVGDDGNKLSGSNARAWMYFTLRLMADTRPDEQALACVRRIHARAQRMIREDRYAEQMKEIAEAAAQLLAGPAGSGTKP